jgi:hypothetical protein
MTNAYTRGMLLEVERCNENIYKFKKEMQLSVELMLSKHPRLRDAAADPGGA